MIRRREGDRLEAALPSHDHPPVPKPLAIVVMGVSGSGKSTLGESLAAALDAPFLEGDDFHDAAAVAKMRRGEALTDTDRWPWLDRLGRAARTTLDRSGIVVVACSALRRAYRDRLRAAIGRETRFVLLDGSRDELQRRLASRSGHYMPPSLLDSQLATLERPGPDEPATALDTDAPPELLCRAALSWIAG